MTDGFRLLGKRFLASGAFLDLSRLHYSTGSGRTARREVITHPGAVGVVPLIDGHVVLISQYRVAVDQYVLEIPAGKLDAPGEDPATTALRECEEEIGYRPGRLTLLHEFFTTPGFTNEIIWLFKAEHLEPVPARPHGFEEEAAEIVHLPVPEALRRVRDGEIRDAKTLIGLLALEKEWTA